MQNGSHSKHMHSAGKHLPKEVAHTGIPDFEVTSTQRRTLKDVHHAKCRAFDKKAAADTEE